VAAAGRRFAIADAARCRAAQCSLRGPALSVSAAAAAVDERDRHQQCECDVLRGIVLLLLLLLTAY